MKIEVEGFPRHVGPTPGHLTECLVVQQHEVYMFVGGYWPPTQPENGPEWPYCTCDDWSPE